MKPSLKRSFLSFITLLALTFGVIGSMPAHAMNAPQSTPAHAINTPQRTPVPSPEGLLNQDGTLNMDKASDGTLDISGWNVQMDPLRGPVFAHPEQAAYDEWVNAVGGGGSGSVNDTVTTIAVSGTDVYVGGYFTNATGNYGTSLPTADYILKWDSLTGNWSALGSNGAGDGSLNGTVSAIAVIGTDVYVGGEFTNINNNGTSLPAADKIAKWDTQTGNWSALGSNGAGEGALNDWVYEMAVSGTDLYVGGAFIDVNNNGTILTAADKIAKWDTLTGTWSALGSNGAGNGSFPTNGNISALAISGTDLYVGGDFINVNNNGTILTAADYIAKWDGSAWSALGSNGAGNGSLNSNVAAIAVNGTDLYVGGSFTNVNNSGTALPTADYIARWNGSAWSALNSNGAGNGSVGGYVNTIVIKGTDVYVGGSFSVNNNGTFLYGSEHIAKWDGSNWSALGSNGAGAGAIPDGKQIGGWDGFFNYFSVYAIALIGTTLYAGGWFEGAQNNKASPSANYLVQYQTQTGDWSPLTTNSTHGSLNNTVRAIVIGETGIYLGGSFTDAKDYYGRSVTAADYIVRWSELGSNGAGDGALNGTVRAIAISGTDVYVGGSFTNVNNNGTILHTADYVAKWDSLTGNWSALGSNGTGNGALGSGSSVLALAVSGTDVYVGGHFVNVNNNGTSLPAADYIAKWNGSAWSSLSSNSAGNGSLNGDVNAITASGTNLYVGGAFVNINNNGTILNTADYVAKWNGSAWSALGSNGAGNGSLNNFVNAIAVNGTDVYVGGGFLNVNNNGTSLPTADYVAKWNGTNWASLGSNGAGDGSLNNVVNAIAVSGANVYVGGSFTNVNNTMPAADYIAKWNSNVWSALSSNINGNGSLNNPVYAIAASETELFVGGDFINVNNHSQTNLIEADYMAAYGTLPNPILSVTINQTAGQTDPTSTRLLSFTATFSEPVSGFDNDIWSPPDLQVGLSDPGCAPLVSLTGSGATYTITLTNMNKECTATVSIPAGAAQSISHPTAFNTASTSTDNSQRFQYGVKTYTSIAANDGWILESTASSNIGGSMNNSATTLSVGDDATNRSYRMITRFDTSTDPIPNAAIINGANYRVTQASITGTNPLSTHGSLRTFLKSPFFGSSPNLETLDYQAGADTGACVFETTLLSDNGYRCVFYAAALRFIPKNDILDLRSQFDADNADSSVDLLNINSGNAATARPKLFVSYYFIP